MTIEREGEREREKERERKREREREREKERERGREMIISTYLDLRTSIAVCRLPCHKECTKSRADRSKSGGQ